MYQDVSAQAVAGSKRAPALPRICVGGSDIAGAFDFERMVAEAAADATPRVSAEAWSIMLYTSGTTSRPKGVPRRHRAERAAGIAHVAQNLYRRGERTLGVMPLYHTMGVRSLIAMSLIGGTFVCLPRYDTGRALALIEAEKITNLYLVPTLYHDLVHAREFASTDVSSVRKLGFAGASMTDGLLKTLNDAFRPDLFVNHYGSSEIYTFTIDQNAPAKPGSAGKAGINQQITGRQAERQIGDGRRARPMRKARSSRCWPATSSSRATGGGPTRTPKRCATAGISPAIPASSTAMATCSSPAASTT